MRYLTILLFAFLLVGCGGSEPVPTATAPPPIVNEPARVLPDTEMRSVRVARIADDEGNEAVFRPKDKVWCTDDEPEHCSMLINSLVDQTLLLLADPLVTEDEAEHVALRVTSDNFVRRMQLELDDDSVLTVYMGTTIDEQSHVRSDGDSAVYLTRYPNFKPDRMSAIAADWR